MARLDGRCAILTATGIAFWTGTGKVQQETMPIRLPARRSDRALLALAVLAASLVATCADESRLRHQQAGRLERNRELAGTLRLTDVCLFGDAPTTRHLSQTDGLGTTQDFPGAFDHSASGSLVRKPVTLRTPDAIVDESSAITR
jgi:hypothetical protein